MATGAGGARSGGPGGLQRWYRSVSDHGAQPHGRVCAADHPAAPLPEWARGGFFPPARPMPHVLGDRGEIVAILWAEQHPLQAPPPVDRNNKILWVTRDGSGGPLEIRATLRASGASVTRSLAEGPGPSVVDLPAPGCWSLDLSWDGTTTT